MLVYVHAKQFLELSVLELDPFSSETSRARHGNSAPICIVLDKYLIPVNLNKESVPNLQNKAFHQVEELFY